MAFALRRDEAFADGVQRVASKQLAKAIEALEQGADDLPSVVHGVRKRSKRVRAVARLVRSGIGQEYQRSNVAVRDAARELGPVREAPALLGTFDALVAASPQHHANLHPVRRGLVQRTRTTPDVDLDRVIEGLLQARRLVKGWHLDDDVDMVAEGLEGTYRLGRRALREAVTTPSAEAFHEWRKSAKHLWHQTQLFEPAAPSVLTRQARALHHLADALGDDHDLAVLVALLREDEGAFGGAGSVTAAIGLAEERRADLERRAVRLGARLYVEKPKAFTARMLGLWEAWQEHGDEEPTGEIAAIAPPIKRP